MYKKNQKVIYSLLSFLTPWVFIGNVYATEAEVSWLLVIFSNIIAFLVRPAILLGVIGSVMAALWLAFGKGSSPARRTLKIIFGVSVALIILSLALRALTCMIVSSDIMRCMVDLGVWK